MHLPAKGVAYRMKQKRWNGMRRKFGAVTAAAVAVIVLRAGAQEAVPPTAEALAAISERGQLLYEYTA